MVLTSHNLHLKNRRVHSLVVVLSHAKPRSSFAAGRRGENAVALMLEQPAGPVGALI